jgi:hypothetical protein
MTNEHIRIILTTYTPVLKKQALRKIFRGLEYGHLPQLRELILSMIKRNLVRPYATNLVVNSLVENSIIIQDPENQNDYYIFESSKECRRFKRIATSGLSLAHSQT